MKLNAKILNAGPKDVEFLKSQGVEAKAVKGGVIITLREIEEGVYYVPPEAKNALLLIEATEEGGAMTSTGSATIVCTPDGRPLRPFYVPKGVSNGDHAYFCARQLITITGQRRNNLEVVIEEHTIVCEGSAARIKTNVLFDGEAPAVEWKCDYCGHTLTDPGRHNDPDGSECLSSNPKRVRVKLPNHIGHLSAAVLAAREKGDCYHCRHVHFAAGS